MSLAELKKAILTAKQRATQQEKPKPKPKREKKEKRVTRTRTSPQFDLETLRQVIREVVREELDRALNSDESSDAEPREFPTEVLRALYVILTGRSIRKGKRETILALIRALEQMLEEEE